MVKECPATKRLVHRRMGVWYLDFSRCDKWSASCRSDTCTTTVHADTISVAVHPSDITALANPQFDRGAGHFVLRPRGFPMGITLTRSQREGIPWQRNRGRQFLFNINSGCTVQSLWRNIESVSVSKFRLVVSMSGSAVQLEAVFVVSRPPSFNLIMFALDPISIIFRVAALLNCYFHCPVVLYI